jgi:hypothetical protein
MNLQIIKNYIIKLNLIAFPIIFTLSIFISILESYKYIGFFQKHSHISSIIIYLLSFLSFVILAKSEILIIEIKKKRLLQIFLGAGTFGFFVFVLLYVIFNEFEIANYINYSFATFHIWPGALIITILLSFQAAYIFFKINSKFEK